MLESAFIELEKNSWLKADILFERVINRDPGNAEAYLGKLMVELRVRTRNDLKNCSDPFNEMSNYKKAFMYADDSLKQFLKETIQHINKRNHETKCKRIYDNACMLMDNQCFEEAIAEFEKIRGYRDADKKIEECYAKIAEIKSAILATQVEKEKRYAERREAFKAKLPLIKKVSLSVVPILIISIIAVSVLSNIDWNKGNIDDNSLNQTGETDSTSQSKPTNINYGSKEINQSSKEIQSDDSYTITDYNTASQIIYKSTYGPNDTKWSTVDYQFDASGEYYRGFIERQFYGSGALSLYCEVELKANSRYATSVADHSYKEYYYESGEIQKIVDAEYELIQDANTLYNCAKTVMIYYTKDKVLAEKYTYQNSINNGTISIIETHYKYDNNGSIISEVITDKENIVTTW